VGPGLHATTPLRLNLEHPCDGSVIAMPTGCHVA